MNVLEEELNTRRDKGDDDPFVFVLNTLPLQGGVTFDVFLLFFEALCSNKEVCCEHSSTILYTFENDLLVTYQLLQNETYHTDNNTTCLYEIRCKTRPGYMVEVRTYQKREITIPPSESASKILVSTMIKETWTFRIGHIKYILTKSAVGPTKDDIPSMDPRFDIEMTSPDVWNTLDLFGRFDSNGHVETLDVMIEKKG
jgi:hypothetical protein